MAERPADGYFMHAAVIRVATDSRAIALSPKVEPRQIVPVRERDSSVTVIAWPVRRDR
jgi:hypothetical protein